MISNLNFKKISYLAFTALIAGVIAMPSDTQAARIARFSAEGQNHISTTDIKSDIESTCTVTIVNTSPYPQKVTVTIRLVSTATIPSPNPLGYVSSGTCGTPPTFRTYASSPAAYVEVIYLGPFKGSGTTECRTGSESGASDTCTLPRSGGSSTMTFPGICTGTRAIQSVRCEGDIVVEDIGTSPGHVIASGALGVFVEARGGASLSTDNFGNEAGGTSKTNTAAPSFIPIVIGEGRPF